MYLGYQHYFSYPFLRRRKCLSRCESCCVVILHKSTLLKLRAGQGQAGLQQGLAVAQRMMAFIATEALAAAGGEDECDCRAGHENFSAVS